MDNGNLKERALWKQKARSVVKKHCLQLEEAGSDFAYNCLTADIALHLVIPEERIC